jgi:hypothetical protein
MPTVRTTLQPDVDLDVSDGEVEVLRHQGLLVEEPRADQEPPATPLPRAATPGTAAKPLITSTPAQES